MDHRFLPVLVIFLIIRPQIPAPHEPVLEFNRSLSIDPRYRCRSERVGRASHIHRLIDWICSEKSYIIHPAILDTCFQIGAYRPFRGDFSPNDYYLPSRIEEFILHRQSEGTSFPSHVYIHLKLSCWMPDSMRYHAVMVDDFGKRICTLKFEVTKHRIALLRISSPLHIVL
ncbi:hypothetical protein C8J57DRAFT_1096257 [Mycena rebaudengoi]|nr:hypothetical protein C8J57DRAFT_1096257 [Mycena rebaudengoi]